MSEISGMGLGTRLAHSIASSRDLHSQSQKPATSSLGFGKGPLVTVLSTPENVTRAAFDVGCNPPSRLKSFRTPAAASSSLNLPIAASNSGLGIAPVSEVLLA